MRKKDWLGKVHLILQGGVGGGGGNEDIETESLKYL